MDHLDADKTKAVERYVLGDLSVSEVEEFERHFFDCPQCSEELRTLTLFQANARAVFGEQDLAPIPIRVPAPESAAGWWRGFSPLFWNNQLWKSGAMALAALIIGVFAGYMAFGMHGAAQVGSFPLYAQARGEETVVSPAAASRVYTLYFDKTWEGDYSSYRAVFHDASGAEKFAAPITPGAPGETMVMAVPTRELPSGKYVLVIMGANSDKGTELARFPFTLKIK
jgi:hypothetical protein